MTKFTRIGRTGGFTLVELMVTLAVLAILVSLAVPAFNQVEQRRVIGAAESAVNLLQMARTESIKQGRDIYFVSQSDGDGWCFGISDSAACDCSAVDGAGASCTIALSREDDVSVGRATYTTTHSDFRGVDLAADGEESVDVEVQFDHVRGTLVGGVPAEIWFETDRRGFRMAVQVNAIGRPRACGPDGAIGMYRAC